MRIAMCFHGLHPDITNQKWGSVKLNRVPDYLQKYVFEPNKNIDSFVHSWSVDKKRRNH